MGDIDISKQKEWLAELQDEPTDIERLISAASSVIGWEFLAQDKD